MKRMMMSLIAAACIAAAIVFVACQHEPAIAEGGGGGAEFGLLISVPSAESYKTELDRWAGGKSTGGKDLKDVAKNGVFIYQANGNATNDRAAYIARLNELGAEGWMVVETQPSTQGTLAQTLLMRRP